MTGIEAAEPAVPIVSTLTGAPATAAELRCADYWVRHVRETVRFADAVTALAAKGADTFLELGAAPVLTALGPDCLPDAEDTAFVPAGRKDTAELPGLLAALAAVHTRGFDVDWPALYERYAGRRVELPTYAFEHRRYWLPTPAVAVGDAAGHGLAAAGHPLVSARLTCPTTPASCSPAGSPPPPTRSSPNTRSSARSWCPAPPWSTSPCTPDASPDAPYWTN